MSDKKSNVCVSGVGLLDILGVVFIVLKLLGKINWSWWLVCLPLYAPVLFGLVVGLWVLALVFGWGHKNKKKEV